LSASSWSSTRRDESEDHRLRRGSLPLVMSHRVAEVRGGRAAPVRRYQG
jgi:hypothetical protein